MKKRSFILTKIIFTIFFLIIFISDGICFIKGDFNDDGKIDILEAINALQITAGIKKSSYKFSTSRVQNGVNADGTNLFYVWIEIHNADDTPSDDVISDFKIYDPNNNLLNIKEGSLEYSSATNYWGEYIDGISVTGYSAIMESEILNEGIYTFHAIDNTGANLESSTWNFNGKYSDLPVVDADTITSKINQDGSLNISWALPQGVENLSESEWKTGIRIDVYSSNEKTIHEYYGQAPLTSGTTQIQKEMFDKLKSLGDELRCMIRIQDNNSSNRSYSLFKTIWSK
ncbi:Uncharacterized protein dnl_25710 [Desulfonema limicola]|uniref:EF-hand domain-containing protein n=1 Tax=Desulfonema limicola TaxID=45656 RepID=A0A975B7N2_9BACT|nr:hypothetical protein [Desulfonema limicola]QTA80274.1 Uncharacterized protein dnl_25710 [Desulfonema limicola]